VVDWDFWLRVARAFQTVWVEYALPTTFVRWHAESETHRFRRGTADLEEIERLFAKMERVDRPACASRWPTLDLARRAWLARAYVNRAQSLGWTAGDPGRGLRCLRRACALDRATVARSIATDPKFAAQIAAMLLAPGLVRLRARAPAKPVGERNRGSQPRRSDSEARNSEHHPT
jgi:hypothetical protein